MMTLVLLLSLSALVIKPAFALGYIEYFEALQDNDEFVWPTPNSSVDDITCTSVFGPRSQGGNAYDFHRGLDIMGLRGDPIVAVYFGVVSWIKTYRGSGLTMFIEHKLTDPVKLHEDKPAASHFYTVYMHLDETLVQSGDSVEAGQIIARMGNSGGSDYPFHLHLEVRLIADTMVLLLLSI